ncbi:MAG: hypothetical protein M3Y85_03010 [Bacteroidota bacterium]|nr:hypothetical protein [Bacteroidota bacterium]
MKKSLFILICFLLGTTFIAQAQCDAVTAEAFAMEPQSGAHNHFGVRVTLSQVYGQDVTVTGYIHRDTDENGNQDHPFTLTITAGSLTAETAANFYETDPTSGAAVTVASVSPCPSSNDEIYFENLLRSYNTPILQNPDTTVAIAHMIEKNQEYINYLTSAFPATFNRNSMVVDDVAITWVGLLHAIAVGEGRFSNSTSKLNKKDNDFTFAKLSGPNAEIGIMPPEIWQSKLYDQSLYRLDWPCVKNVVLGFFDLASLVEDYVALVQSGASWNTVRGLIWRTVKRYAGWGAAVAVVYEIATKCL